MIGARIDDVLARYADDLRQFARYFGVSLCALAVDVTVYCGLLSVLHFAAAAAIGGYVFGVITHYMICSRLVFRSQFYLGSFVYEIITLAKYFAASSTGLVVTVVVTGVLGDVLKFDPIIAKLVATGCSFFVVFLNMKIFILGAPPRRPALDRLASRA